MTMKTIAVSDIEDGDVRRAASSSSTIGWSADRIDRLSKLWAAGYSASKIAEALGGVSRSAVIGKAYRLGLESRTTKTRKPRAGGRKPRPPRPIPIIAESPRKWDDKRGVYAAADEPVAALELFVAPARRVRSIADVADRQCRFLIGDPQESHSHFCDREQMPGSSYCQHHHARCTTVRAPKNQSAVKHRVPVSRRVLQMMETADV